MISVMMSWLVEESVVEKEVYDGRKRVRAELEQQLSAYGEIDDPVDVVKVSAFPEIVYDERGKPRPAAMAYDYDQSDVPDDSGDDVADGLVPLFPGLDPPLG